MQRCSVVHISPAGNNALKLITPQQLRHRYGDRDLFELWSTVVRRPHVLPRFRWVSTGQLFTPLEGLEQELEDWWRYVSHRYAGALVG